MAEDNSEATPAAAWSTTSISSASAETANALAIATKVSSLGIYAPRSSTLMCVVLMFISAASSSWVAL